MKFKTPLLTALAPAGFAAGFLAVAAFTVGCNKTETTSQQLEKVQAKSAAASQEMKDYTFSQKAEFTEHMQGELAGINRDLDLLSTRIEASSDAVKSEAKPKLQALRAQADRLKAQLARTTDATESTWDSVKAGSKKAYAELKDGFTQARQWVSDKIAP